MTLFDLVHFSPQQAGRSRAGRWLAPIGLLAFLLLPLSTQGLAQAPDWGKWEVVGNDKGIPPGTGYPGGHNLCEGMSLAGRHAYWRCMPGCPGIDVINQFCWQAVSDGIYTCPDGKGFRRLERVRHSKVHCGPKDWQLTKHHADLYEETWQTKVTTPPEETTPQAPPTTDAELPTTADGSSVQWGGGPPPWAPKEEAKTDTDTGKTDTPKTDTGKTDTGKLDTPKTDTGKTDTPKTDTPKTDTAKTDTGQKTVTGGGSSTTPSNSKKANKKEVRNKGGGRTIDRSRGGDDIDPETAAAIGSAVGIGIGMGLGGLGRGGHMGGDRGRMMDR